jgi:hypothetical protein
MISTICSTVSRASGAQKRSMVPPGTYSITM